MKPTKINPEKYQLFLENDYELALEYGSDICFF